MNVVTPIAVIEGNKYNNAIKNDLASNKSNLSNSESLLLINLGRSDICVTLNRPMVRGLDSLWGCRVIYAEVPSPGSFRTAYKRHHTVGRWRRTMSPRVRGT